MSYRILLVVMFTVVASLGALFHLADFSPDGAAASDPYDVYARPCLPAPVLRLAQESEAQTGRVTRAGRAGNSRMALK